MVQACKLHDLRGACRRTRSKAILGYKVKLRPACATGGPVSNKTKLEKKSLSSTDRILKTLIITVSFSFLFFFLNENPQDGTGEV